MRTSTSSFSRRLSAVLLGTLFGTLHAPAASYTFTNLSGDNQYTTATNWSGLTVPNTANGDTATINNGSAVTYTPGGDLTIKNGGVLEVTNGSFTQVVGNAYIQLNGTGTVLVDGGTFNQGTASSSPFNVSGTGNVFNMSAGAANLNHGFNVSTGLTSTLSGGTLTVTGGSTTVAMSLTLSGANANLGNSLSVNATGTLAVSGGNITSGDVTNAGMFSITNGALTGGNVTNSGTLSITSGTQNVGRFTNTGSFSMSGGTLTTTGEFDFNNNQNTLSGGTINTTLITGVNGTGTKVFNISGGALTLSSNNSGGIYGGNTSAYINFTASSTGYMEFLSSTNDSITTVQNFIKNNVIEYNDTPYNATTGYSNFSITKDGSGNIFLSLAMTAVPEPATFAAGGLLLACAAPVLTRRLRRRSV